MPNDGYLSDIVAVLGAGVLVALVLGRLRVASVAGMVLAGVLIGPHGLAVVDKTEHVDVLADVGVALLLFGIGLELTPDKLRKLKREAFVAGTGQVLATVAAFAGLAWSLGTTWRQAVFLGCVAALSSTAVVLSRLDRRRELDRPHGRLALGVLVLQDIAVVPMVLLVPVLAGADLQLGDALFQIAGKTVFVVGMVLVGRRVARVALDTVASSSQRDLFGLASLTLCLLAAWLAALVGVSLAVGAFIGGVVIASTPFRHQSLAQIVPLRDVLASFFFVSIGMLLDPSAIADAPGTVAGLAAALVVGKALLVLVVTRLAGWPVRVGLAGALALAQVGEFSFVLVHAAQGTDLLPSSLEAPAFAAIALSLLLTPLLIDLAPRAGAAFGRTALGRALERREDAAPPSAETPDRPFVLIAGYGAAGRAVRARLRGRDVDVRVVDLNPSNVRAAESDGALGVYGDVSDPHVLRAAGAEQALALVVAVNDEEATLRAVRSVRTVAPTTRLLVRCAYSAAVERLREAGADDVVDLEDAGAAELARRVGGLVPPADARP